MTRGERLYQQSDTMVSLLNRETLWLHNYYVKMLEWGSLLTLLAAVLAGATFLWSANDYADTMRVRANMMEAKWIAQVRALETERCASYPVWCQGKNGSVAGKGRR